MSDDRQKAKDIPTRWRLISDDGLQAIREVLDFYGREENWFPFDLRLPELTDRGMRRTLPPLIVDRGRGARDALYTLNTHLHSTDCVPADSTPPDLPPHPLA